MSRAIRQAIGTQSGVALITAVIAIFILTVVVAALTLATMGETGLSFDQSRSTQAFQLAEAGAYRALAELRRRISVDLPAQIAGATNIAARCQTNQGWRIIAEYAQAPGATPWTDEGGTRRRAILNLGSRGAPIEVRDAAGNVVGSFFTTIYVRTTHNGNPAGVTPNPAHQCNPPAGPNSVESYRIWFDYFIVATGTTRNSERTICLKNPGNSRSCGEWLASADPGGVEPGDTFWDSPPPTHGWEVFIFNASYARWALMLLTSSTTWFTDASILNGPVHTNSRLQIWGNPTFASTVTQVRNDVLFGNGGPPHALLAANDNCGSPTPDCPVYQSSPMQRGWCDGVGGCGIAPPSNSNPFWAVLGDDPARAGMPNDNDVRPRTTQLPNTGPPGVPDGIYLMDECGTSVCGGIYVQGDVTKLELKCNPDPCVATSNQEIYVYHTNAGVTAKKFILDRGTNSVWRCDGPTFSCTDTSKGFNGMLFVKGSVTSSGGLTGLFGSVQETTRLTVAADGEIRITNHLYYQSPPNAPDDPIPNVLGLYAWCSTTAPGDPTTCSGGPPRNVTIDGAVAPNDLFVDAAVLVPWGKFWVEGWDTLPDKGRMRLLGGTVQKDFGPWGGFRFVGATEVRSAYRREMAYDERFLANNAPPFFPLTGVLTADRASLPVDVLYDRPLWEELTAQ